MKQSQHFLLLYRRGLDARYGTGIADTLEERRAKQRRCGRKQKIQEMKEKLASMPAA
jgi:hypothetical protein